MMAVLACLLAVYGLIHTVDASSCGGGAIPFRFEVLPSGLPVLGCATPSCFGGQGGNNAPSNADSQFQNGPGGRDGFLRQGDSDRPHFRHPDAPPQRASCSAVASEAACSSPRQWVGGLSGLQSGTDSLALQCCSYDGLRFATELGRPQVNPGEVFSGGEVLRDGRQTGFDLISDVRKTVGPDGSVSYELTVSRMNCIPDPPEIGNNVNFSPDDIVQILNAEQPIEQPIEQPFQQPFQPQPQPVGQPGYAVLYQPAAVAPQAAVPQAGGFGQNPACFSGDTEVLTKLGRKTMEQLRIGDEILTADRNRTSFVPVTSFLHRLPHTHVNYQRIVTSDGAVLQLTAQHFIYKVPCEDKLSLRNLVYAEEIGVGDCVYRLARDGAGLVPTRVMNVTVVSGVGAYAPMTSNGDLIVNGMLASCHNIVRSASLQQTFFHYAREMEMLGRWMFGQTLEAEGTVDELPPGVHFLLSVLGYILPQSMLSH